MNQRRRGGLTLVELLVVGAMLGVLLALLLPAVQKVRQASKREACAEKLMQIGVALHNYHDTYGVLPSGIDSTPYPPAGTNVYWCWSWMAHILPYVGQEDLWQQADNFARTVSYDPWFGGGNPGLRAPLEIWHCPADDRELLTMVALTDYLGISGTHSMRVPLGGRGNYTPADEGVFFENSQIRFADITNGLSNVLFVGERPPSEDHVFGWWFAGTGQPYSTGTTGSADVVLGVSEQNVTYSECPRGVDYQFMPGDVNSNCDLFHYWSLHHHGANFLLADASVHFFKYTIDPAVLIAMAYRSGGPP